MGSLRIALVVMVAACVIPASEAAATAAPVKVSFQGQSHSAKPGSAWAYYIHAQQQGHPWHGTVDIAVETTKGRVIDQVGRFPFAGSLLDAYLWNAADHGVLLFKVTFAEGAKTVAVASYRVRLT